MVDNVVSDAGSGGATLAMREITHGGDTAQLAGAFLVGISGAEGSYTWGAINGDATNGLEVDVTRLSALVTGTAEIGNVKNSGTFATQATLQSGTAEIGEVTIGAATGAAGDLAKAEDAVHASGDIGVMSLAVRNDVLAALAGTDGDYAPLQVNASGALYIQEGSALDVSAATVTVDWAGTAPPIGAGVEATALRVTLATDSTGLLSVDDNGGSLTVDNAGLTELAAAINASELDVNLASSNATVTVDLGANNDVSLNAGSNLAADVGLSGARTSGGTTLYKNIDVDESEDQVKGSAGQIYWIHAINSTAAPLFLKIYNVAAASVTVGTTVPDLTFPVPANADSDGAGFTLSVPNGIAFGTAITIAATTGVADADSGAPGLNALVVNLGYA